MYVTDVTIYASAVKLIAVGNEVVKQAIVSGASAVLYTVPTGKTAYVYYISFYAWNKSSTYAEDADVEYTTATGYLYRLLWRKLPPGGTASEGISFTFLRLNAGDYISLFADVDVTAYCSLVIVEA